jgi:hypothetical protein
MDVNRTSPFPEDTPSRSEMGIESHNRLLSEVARLVSRNGVGG